MRRIWLVLIFALVGKLAQAQANGILEAVESGVTLKLAAPFQTDGARKLYLDVQTNDAYECANFTLENGVRQKKDKLTVQIKGVRRTEPCADGMAPASCRIDLTDLKRGTHKVRVIINMQVFRSKFIVADSSYEFRIRAAENPKLFRIYNGQLHIIPDNCIWGKCTYTDPKKKLEAQKFMADLERAGAQKTTLPVGNYDEFYLHSPGTTEQKTIQGQRYEYPFVYRYSGDPLVLQEVMNAYRDGLQITLKTTKGAVFGN